LIELYGWHSAPAGCDLDRARPAPGRSSLRLGWRAHAWFDARSSLMGEGCRDRNEHPQSTEARSTAAVMHLVPSSSPAAASIDVHLRVTTSTMPVTIID
jgi:hypothetical protein